MFQSLANLQSPTSVMEYDAWMELLLLEEYSTSRAAAAGDSFAVAVVASVKDDVSERASSSHNVQPGQAASIRLALSDCRNA